MATPARQLPPGGPIDFHTHAFPDAIAPVAMEKLSSTAGVRPRGDGTVGGVLASMDRCGIAASVVHSIATAPRQAVSIRRWALSIRSPRIIPFPSVHPGSATMREELEAIAADGFTGIKLHPEYQDFYCDEDRLLPLYRACRDLGLVVFFHAGEDISFPPSDRAAPRRLAAVRSACPGLIIIAAHSGGWRRWEEVGTCLLGEDLYLEISFTRGHLPDGLFRDLLTGHRPDRILFGSDFPWDDQGDSLRHLEALDLPPALLDRILRRNAESVLSRR
jgi:uncharacterized protein